MGDLISRKALVKALLAEREKYPPEVAERYSLGVKLPHRFNQAVRGAIRMALRYIETAPSVADNSVESLAAELERVKRERDAAIADINMVCQCDVCTRMCKYDKPNPYCECADFEWRGVKED